MFLNQFFFQIFKNMRDLRCFLSLLSHLPACTHGEYVSPHKRVFFALLAAKTVSNLSLNLGIITLVVHLQISRVYKFFSKKNKLIF